MRLEEIMSKDVAAVRANDDAEAAFQRMHERGIHHLVVKDGAQVVGILSDRDLGGARASSWRRGVRVGELMTLHAVTAEPETTVRKAANLMRGHTIGCLPVIRRGTIVGIVTTTDLLELLGSPGAGSPGRTPRPSRVKPVRRSVRRRFPAPRA